MKKSIIIIGFYLLTIGLYSCKKEFVQDTPIPKRPAKMAELTSSNNFSWRTVKNVNVKIQGSHVMTTTIMTANGEIYFKGIVKPNEGIETTIAIPSTLNEILVIYGPFKKAVTITNNTIDCTFNLNNF